MYNFIHLHNAHMQRRGANSAWCYFVEILDTTFVYDFMDTTHY